MALFTLSPVLRRPECHISYVLLRNAELLLDFVGSGAVVVFQAYQDAPQRDRLLVGHGAHYTPCPLSGKGSHLKLLLNKTISR